MAAAATSTAGKAAGVTYKYLGRSGLKVSSICLGTMTFGGADAGLPGNCTKEQAFSLMDAFEEAGGNFVDTANVYNGGESESIVGQWLAAGGEKRRREIVLSTKVRFTAPGHSGPNAVGLSRGHIVEAIDDSLKRLATSYIDLYITHAFDDGTPVEETVRTMASLIDSGKIRYWALSNVTGWQLMKILAECDRLSLPRPVAVQEQYSLLCRQTEWEVLACCVSEGVSLLPWSPLKGGWLTGKMTREGAPEGSRARWADTSGRKLQSSPGHSSFGENDAVWALLDVMRGVADKSGASVPQVALRWLLQRDGVPSVVIGAKKASQLEDNLGAGHGWEISAEDMAALTEASSAVIGTLPYPYEMVFRVQSGRERS